MTCHFSKLHPTAVQNPTSDSYHLYYFVYNNIHSRKHRTELATKNARTFFGAWIDVLIIYARSQHNKKMMLKKASSTTSSRVMQRTPLRCINGGGGARITRPVVRGATGNGGAGAAAADAATKASDAWRTTEGKELTRDEAASLARALAAADSASTTQQQLLLRDGAAKRAADLVALEGAVLRAEQAYLNAAAGNGGAEADLAAANIKGVDAVAAVRQWQPIFASAGGFPRLLYIPVPEYFDVSAAAAASSDGKGAIDIVTEMGPVTTHFLGDCEWVAAGGSGSSGGSGGSASKLEYAISKCVVRVPAWRWFKLEFPFPLRNALAFFYYDAAAGVAAARSRLGGTMLMVAEPAGGAKYSLAGTGGGIREEGIERE
jgi:hypothetical protein